MTRCPPRRTPPPDEDPEPDDPDGWPGHHAPDVTETDNPVVAVLYHPDGDPLVVIHERRTVPFGYQPPTQQETTQ